MFGGSYVYVRWYSICIAMLSENSRNSISVPIFLGVPFLVLFLQGVQMDDFKPHLVIWTILSIVCVFLQNNRFWDWVNSHPKKSFSGQEGKTMRFYVPLWIIAIATLFAAIPSGLLNWEEWRYAMTLQDKLVFSDVRVHKALSEDGSVSVIQLGAKFKNQSIFPIELEVQRIHTSLEDYFPPKGHFQKYKFVIPAEAFGWIDDFNINLRDAPKKNKVMEGSIRVHLRYGRPGKLDQELEINKTVFIQFDEVGDIKTRKWQETLTEDDK